MRSRIPRLIWFCILISGVTMPMNRVVAETVKTTSSPDVLAVGEPQIVEAEQFEQLGGWNPDSQFMDQLGSTVLIAHGLGEPVADATTIVTFPEVGTYEIWVRTRNWVAPWTFPEKVDQIDGVTEMEATAFAALPLEQRQRQYPGAFQICVDDQPLDTIFGTKTRNWTWEKATGNRATIQIDQPNTSRKISIHDLCGFDGRVDAVLFVRVDALNDETTEMTSDQIEALRRARTDTTPTAVSEKPYDLVVVGGGIAGTCAAISAARLGCKVALIQDRPVLGGNGSTEIRVHLNGHVNLPPYPNLGNLAYLMGPLAGGNAREASHYKDAERAKLVAAEKNIDLFLNTRVVDVVKEESSTNVLRITAVIGRQVITGEYLAFAGQVFADCTGDGNVGFLAGADWRMGRESKAETGEGEAPDVADRMTMGSSIQWYTEEMDQPQSFPVLPWAVPFTAQSIRPMLKGDWDWENGLNEDQIRDFEKIRDRGLRAAYGHWSFMKNHCGNQAGDGWDADGVWAAQVKNRRFGWVAYIAGKRESRRLLGDVILCQQDIQGNRPWPDASVTTTWSIDIHYPEKENSRFFPGEAFRAWAKQIEIKPYAIPYRCFYSRNVDNLFMAGRDISVTHVALGTIRVMRTGGMMGEVVGMAAAICKSQNCLPRAVYTDHLDALQSLMREGVAPPPPDKLDAAKALEMPDWMHNAGRNLASLPGVRITASSEHMSGLYPARLAADGQADITDNASRWVSDSSATPHWFQITWLEPVELDTLRVITGQAGGAEGPKTPISNCVLQYDADGSGTWIDIDETRTVDNTSVVILKRFPRLYAKSVRLWMSEPSEITRIWEFELFNCR